MSDADTSVENPARQLANLRWRGQGLDRAIETIEERTDQLTAERIERLRALVEPNGVSEK